MNHLQEVILLIAKDIDKVCKENDIVYYLDGGSALGAIRHGGFIPWDDDFDIIMPPAEYKKFLEVCKNGGLNKNKYTLQEAFVDWPMHFTKIRLNGTTLIEKDGLEDINNGIFVDIFCFDYGSNNKICRLKQYVCAKLWMAHLLSKKPYSNLSFTKRIAMTISRALNWEPICKFIRYQSQSHKKTKFYSIAWGRKRWHNAFLPVDYFEPARYVKFEDYKFPMASKYHEYLTNTFGDYMKLPPECEQQGSHAVKIDFGKYQ